MPRPFPTLLRLINNVSVFYSLRTPYCIIQDCYDFQFTTKYYVRAKLAFKKVMNALPYNYIIFPPNKSTFMLRFLEYQYALFWWGKDTYLCNSLCVIVDNRKTSVSKNILTWNQYPKLRKKKIYTLYTIFCYTFHSLLTCMAVTALQYFLHNC